MKPRQQSLYRTDDDDDDDDDDDMTSSSLLEAALATRCENTNRVLDVKVLYTSLRACRGHRTAQIATYGK